MEKVVLASNNAGKLREFREILEGLFEIVSLRELGLEADPEETGSSFAENARIKAEYSCRLSGLPALADDSGLEVDALGGAPGIYSARYAPGTDADRVVKLLQDMENVEKRTARFVSVVALVYPDGRQVTARGTCEGVITRQPQGAGGFGYDPIFLPDGYDQTFGLLSAETKNSISHRGRAVRALRDKLNLSR
ncbi:MAG: RdgB/HAM1 family non-canonical purine NTP pyrophosphatase [Clostridia bacterium]|nr:RdgB/HAM1 family non-canonical purine NTP pyrophosphatase [Clostridia bacterium]